MIVYSLTDPDEGVVRYIGVSHHSAEKRYAIHLKDAKTKYRRKLYLSNKEKWILSLWKNNKIPIIKTEFDNLSQDEAIKIESELISKYKTNNPQEIAQELKSNVQSINSLQHLNLIF